jgi:O-antigen ligase
MQWALLGLLLLGYKVVPWTVPSLAILVLASALIYRRLDIGLAYAVLTIPFFLYPKAIFGKSFSLVETLVLICTLAWLWRWLRHEIRAGGVRSSSARLSRWLLDWWRSLNTMDHAVLALLLLAVLSLPFSANLGVSIRELRVIIVEPVLLYFLLRQTAWTAEQRMRLADALLLSGVAVSLFGLYQYVGHGDVIVAEGVRRIRGVYASPNNLSLLLGRIVPLGLAVLVAGRPPRRWTYGLALLAMLPCLFLTYSRGAWLLGLPAALLAIGLLRGRRVTFLILGAIALSLLILLPLAGTARVRSLLNWQEGTTFRRLKLWEATVDMIRDHPITGVGLDNFLYQYPNYIRPEAWQEPDLSHPHNIVLDYWTRLGIGGVGVLLWLMAAFFTQALRLYRGLPDGNQRAIILGWIASMVGMLAHGLIDNSYFLVDLAFIFFLALGWVRTLDSAPSVEAAASGEHS